MDANAITLFRELADRSPAERQEYYVRLRVPLPLRAEVESLLRFDGETAGAIRDGVAAAARNAFAIRTDPSGPDRGTGRPEHFPRNHRFSMVRQLGRGGMGVVYEVEDHARHEIVALKTLIRSGPADVYRLKREFRSLAGIAHANLVSLYELVVDEEDCFFTMELVRGVNVVNYVRGLPESERGDAARHVFRQLVDGIEALHRCARLHRDIKPSNVLVAADGRVVILDFGIASDLSPGDGALGERMAGTPAYLAPERRAGAAPSTSHDWYSVGVTLYQMLTGQLPSGDGFDASAAGSEDDLHVACAGLLRHDPATRFSGRDAIDVLAPGAARRPAGWSDADVATTFVGRTRHMEVLERALRATRMEGARTVLVHGPSGIGKSALVQRFLDRVARAADAIVLRGRCYEFESVPYKALDGIIDSLSQYLTGLPQERAERLLPSETGALCRLFPVLRRVAAIAASERSPAAEEQPVSVRRQAFAALRQLLARIARERALVFWIDDLQWADADSAVLLHELLQPPDAPPLLAITSFRDEEISSKPFLRTLLEGADAHAVLALPLETMSEEEARALLASVGLTATAAATALAEVAREAHGNPFLLRQLASYVATHDTPVREATFAGMMAERLVALPMESRRFLDVLAICGRPMLPDIVRDAAGLAGDVRALVAHLRAARLLRSSGSADRVELYHDRIREEIAGRVAADNRRLFQRQLARALIVRGADDPDALFELYREAGEPAEAVRFAILAARKAEAALAFDRTAEYYRAALRLAPDSPERAAWTVRLASALANAGRPVAAADTYLEAAAAAGGIAAMELRRDAAEQLLIGGHIDRGLDVIAIVLRAACMRLPRGPRAALASLWWHRLQVRRRGLDFVSRPAARIAPIELLRIDTCWAVAAGLAFVDTIRGLDFHTRHLLLALESGEPHRVARALALETAVIGTAGGRHRAQVLECAERARAMAEALGDGHAIALTTLSRGIAALLAGEWPSAHEHCERSLRMLRDGAVGTIMELNAAQVFSLGALLFQGELRTVSRQLPALLADARERGNLQLETELRTRMNLVWLAADQPDDGERQADEAMRCWSHAGFHRQHYNHMLVRIQTELYRGRAEAAWLAVGENWPALRRTLLFRVQFMRIEAWYLRARCALLMAANGRHERRFLALARRDARRLASEGTPWSRALAALIDAGVASLERAPATARAKLVQAADGFEAANMKLYAAVAHRRIGESDDDPVRQERRREADRWMAAQGIVRPALMTRLIAPGLAER